ncbi:hypothetical protein [Nocardiopsis sp. LDBS1602]|uniref:hypothetical protein n=1 Tax=Nocardiopsis sp. LDBS1602 TaxID=3109597 RepID=UPI002DB6BDE7|nr:hypothetical protein [Nocardiopsis sp. LDBS1602]MEC3891044.1 hypothetical protein [Nocardiopsis sp. LDBS1602]
MTHTRTTPPARSMLVGAMADGAFKVALGVAFLGGATRLGELLDVTPWLMTLSGVALLIGGGVEIGYVRRRSTRTSTLLMAAYDGGWTVAAIVGLVIAWRGGDMGGEIWIGYQAVAPLAFAALLIAAPSSPSEASRTDDPAGDRPRKRTLPRDTVETHDR